MFQSVLNVDYVKFRTLSKLKWYQAVLLLMQIFSPKTIFTNRANKWMTNIQVSANH